MTLDNGTMNLLLGALLALQGWQLTELIRLKVRVTELNTRLRYMPLPCGGRIQPEKEKEDNE